MTNQVVAQVPLEREHKAALRKILVAQDFSEAADRALADAMTISQQFKSEIVITHVSPRERIYFKFQTLSRGKIRPGTRWINLFGASPSPVTAAENSSRFGDVAKTLAEIASEESADLLMLGAYGDGPKDRAQPLAALQSFCCEQYLARS